MRLQDRTDHEWALSLEKIGLGLPFETTSMPPTVMTLHELITFAHFSNVNADHVSTILTPKNVEVHTVNKLVLDRLDGPSVLFSSIDELSPDSNSSIPSEFLNSQVHPGMPLHDLHLKIGSPVMLLRNLNPLEGLSNGSILEIVQTMRNVLQVKVMSGPHKGKHHFLPRIKLKSDENLLPFTFTRLQFPIVLAYAMTINKSQGQTFDRVGIYLKDNVFAHGQLYVALSRSRRKSNIRLLLPSGESHMSNIVNVVNQAVFQTVLF
jgi:ATP-dependent DNA helicase PIF1